jgi:protein involved in polysaccharide export with SLBB domain
VTVTQLNSPPRAGLRGALALLLLAGLLGMAGSVLGQISPQGSPASPQSGQSATPDSTTGATTSSSTDTDDNHSSASGVPVTLTASQIFGILQEKPEVVIELKSVLATALQQQGVSVQEDSITDEMLYSQISSSVVVRTDITSFLRARGYISEADLQRFAPPGEGGDDSPVSLQTLAQLPGTNFAADSLPRGGTNGVSVTEGMANDGTFPSKSAHPSSGSASRADATQSQRGREARNITDTPQGLHLPTPYNLLSLRDLYTQVPDSTPNLKRFGSEVFLNRDPRSSMRLGGASNPLPLDTPIGPDYVIGPGDGLTIDIWGGISQTFTRIVSRDGRIMLPEAGELQIAGLTLERAGTAIQTALRQQFRNAQVSVTVSQLRTVRIYVVGDVQRPGAYDISSLSSPLSALYAAGGPTAVGSLRILRHYRGKVLIGEIDLYDFLLHGIRNGDDTLQAGDTLLVPPVGPQVAVSGAVKRPAIYEMKGATSLGELLEDAGGVTVAAALGHITIERIDANQLRETVSLNLTSASDPAAARSAIATFQVKDGDRIHVAPILPYSERVVYLEGHVARPGRTPYHDGMTINQILRSYQDLLPEPAVQGEIVRLMPPDLHPVTIMFNVQDVLIGNSNFTLQPFDTIRILGRYDADAPQVTIRGEVLRPGLYPLSQNMTAAELVRMAGGFKRDAWLQDADLMSYRIVNGSAIVSQRTDIQIGDAVLKNVSSADVLLKAGDVLTVHQITGWNDIGASIVIEGEVAHSGSYGFREGEHLSDLLRRAGGFRETAYPEGAVLTRDQVRDLEEKSRAQLISQIEASSAAARLSPNIGGADQAATLQLIQQQQDQVLARLRSQPASGRLVIHITADINSWAGTPADIQVRSGDVLRIPKRPGFVLISGQVYNATAITFVPGKTADWYLQHAGGTTGIANRKEIFIVRANGSVVGRHSGEWYDHVLSTHLDPGDDVVVPQKIIGASLFWRNLLAAAQLASSVAFTAAVAGVL